MFAGKLRVLIRFPHNYDLAQQNKCQGIPVRTELPCRAEHSFNTQLCSIQFETKTSQRRVFFIVALKFFFIVALNEIFFYRSSEVFFFIVALRAPSAKGVELADSKITSAKCRLWQVAKRATA